MSLAIQNGAMLVAVESSSMWMGSLERGILSAMQTYKAHVENGHIVVNEPTDLPEGTVTRDRQFGDHR